MSRQASPKTAFIRKLLDESNGEVTHADARPLLKKEGFDIAKESGDEFEKESNYFNVTKYNWSKLQKSRKGGGRQPVGSKNTKAKTAKNVKRPKHRRDDPVVVRKPRRQAIFASAAGPLAEALAFIEKHGGVKGTQKHIATLLEKVTQAQQEAAVAQAHVETVVALKKRLTKAA